MPSTGPPARGEIRDRCHDRREPGDRAGPQVVAVRKPARQHDDVSALEARLLVPDELGLLAEHVLGGVIGVVIAVGAGKDDDAEFHNHFAWGPTPPPASPRSRSAADAQHLAA